MRNTLFMLILYSCCSGQKRNDNSKVGLNLILSAYVVSPSSIAIKKDSLLVLSKGINADTNNFVFYDYYIVKDKNDWSKVTNDTTLIKSFHHSSTLSFNDTLRILPLLKESIIYYSDILQPNIMYEKLEGNNISFLKVNKKDCEETLFHFTKEYKFLLCKKLYSTFSIYDVHNQKISQYNFTDAPNGIRDFFVKDIIGDSTPELIFIINSPIVRNNQGVEVRVYQINQ